MLVYWEVICTGGFGKSRTRAHPGQWGPETQRYELSTTRPFDSLRPVRWKCLDPHADMTTSDGLRLPSELGGGHTKEVDLKTRAALIGEL